MVVFPKDSRRVPEETWVFPEQLPKNGATNPLGKPEPGGMMVDKDRGATRSSLPAVCHPSWTCLKPVPKDPPNWSENPRRRLFQVAISDFNQGWIKITVFPTFAGPGYFVGLTQGVESSDRTTKIIQGFFGSPPITRVSFFRLYLPILEYSKCLGEKLLLVFLHTQ